MAPDAPFPEAMEDVASSGAVADFSKQGALIGKTKGRKPRAGEPQSKKQKVQSTSGGSDPVVKKRRRATAKPSAKKKELIYSNIGWCMV